MFSTTYFLNRIAAVLLAVSVLLIGTSSSGQDLIPIYSQPIAGVNLLLGSPSHATASDPNDFLIVKPQFALSYNHPKGGPNWVSWHVELEDLEGKAGFAKFAKDLDLPQAWRVDPLAYSNSGYDRGQMCPSADRQSTMADKKATMVMSNVLPQKPALNRGPWRKLEEYLGELVRHDGVEMYMVAGGYGWQETIANNKVYVPERFWKIIVVIPFGDDDLNRIDAKTRIIAVEMPNSSEISRDPWRKYLTTVKAIEARTGYHFFSSLPAELRNILKSKKDTVRR